MNVSENGIATLLHLEGLFVWYGCMPVRATKDSNEAFLSLKSNIVEIEQILNDATKVTLTQSQFDALAIAAFDRFIGIETIKKSKILRLLKNGNEKLIEKRFLELNSFSVKEVPNIFIESQHKRRLAEKDIFCKCVYLSPLAEFKQMNKQEELVFAS